jgi:hypothetical protein
MRIVIVPKFDLHQNMENMEKNAIIVSAKVRSDQKRRLINPRSVAQMLA